MNSFDETVELMLIDLKQVEGTLILFAVCDDTILRDYAVETLRKRLLPEITLRDFRYDPEHISLLEGALEATATSNGRPAASVTGFEALPRDKRTEAIRLLNWERGRFGLTGIAVILWVNRAALAEIATWSADFYSWRSATFIIEPPPGWNTLASTRRGYLQALVAQNEFVNLQGLAPTRGGQIVQMRMEDIFVPLHAEQEVKLSEVIFSFGSEGPVAVEITEDAEGALAARVKTETHRARLVGEAALVVEGKTGSQSVSLSFLEERERRRAQREGKARRVEIPELLQERRAVVLGDPGAGKTTLLRYLTYTLAQAQIADHQSDIINRIPDLADCLPVYVRIGEYAQHLQHSPAATLDTFAPLSCQARQLPLSDELLTDALDRNRVVFLLDGLDEVIAAGQRREVARRIEEFARAHPPCRVIVTSRIVGYREGQLGGGFPQFTISPFADPEIRRFAEKWYGALGEPAGNAERLVRAIQDNLSVRRLAANPLLLTVIALIHWRGTKLPNHRVTLYRLAAETLVDQWMNYRRVSPEGWDVQETLRILLPAIAWHLHSTTSSGLISEQELHRLLVETLRQHDPRLSENEAHSRAAQFRRNVSEFSGIFLERGLDQDGRGLYGFLHLTFEEYFAALRLADKWQREGDSVLKPLLHDPRWTEIILLAAGHFGEFNQYQATRFVRTILEAQSEYEDILHRDLFMAAQCLADDVRVDAELRREILSKLLKVHFDSKSPDALREDVGKVLARLGGTSIEKDMLKALTERLTARKSDVRAVAAKALGQMGQAVATPEVLSVLLKLLADPDKYVRQAAAQALGQMGQAVATPEVLSALLKLLADPDKYVRQAAAQALGQMGQAAATPEVLSTLLKRLTDPEESMRPAVARALGQMGPAAATPEVLSTLLKRLTDPETKGRVAVAVTLGLMREAAATPEVLSTLLKLLADPDKDARFLAVIVLGIIGEAAATPEVLAALLKLLTDPEGGGVRAAVAGVLGRLGQAVTTPQVLSTLLKLLTDPEGGVRAAVAGALGRLGQAATTPQVLSTLLKLLTDFDWLMRREAAEALGQMGLVAATPEVIAALLKGLTDSERDVRAAAAGALGQMGAAAATPEVVAALLKYLTDSEKDVRTAAEEALSNLSAYVCPQERPEVMKLFLPLTRSRDVDSRETGYVGLRNLLVGDHSEAAQA